MILKTCKVNVERLHVSERFHDLDGFGPELEAQLLMWGHECEDRIASMEIELGHMQTKLLAASLMSAPHVRDQPGAFLRTVVDELHISRGDFLLASFRVQSL